MARKAGARAFSLGVVILAAGRSRRMGRAKLLLPWGETSVLGHLVAEWRRLGARQIGVVCAAADQAMQAELDRIRFPKAGRIFNPSPERGMFSSVQCAAQWAGWGKDLTHWAVVLGDQPHLRRETLRRVIEFTVRHPGSICQPMQGGHRRHPVFFPKSAFLQLAGSAAVDLKEFLSTAAQGSAFCALDDPGLDLDIDRPQDYERALALAGPPRRSGRARKGKAPARGSAARTGRRVTSRRTR